MEDEELADVAGVRDTCIMLGTMLTRCVKAALHRPCLCSVNLSCCWRTQGWDEHDIFRLPSHCQEFSDMYTVSEAFWVWTCRPYDLLSVLPRTTRTVTHTVREGDVVADRGPCWKTGAGDEVEVRVGGTSSNRCVVRLETTLFKSTCGTCFSIRSAAACRVGAARDEPSPGAGSPSDPDFSSGILMYPRSGTPAGPGPRAAGWLVPVSCARGTGIARWRRLLDPAGRWVSTLC